MTDAYRAFMAAAGRPLPEPIAKTDFAFTSAHHAPADVVEAMDAICRTCGARTEGTWQASHGGPRFRAPSDHAAGFSKVCPGAFALAELSPPKEGNDDE